MPKKKSDQLATLDLRMRIIEEYRLRREIRRHETMKREDPERWRRFERWRLERNRDTSELNRALKAAGCTVVELEPSLEQQLRKLQQLEARNRAETETFRKPR